MSRLRFLLFIFLCSLLWACYDQVPEWQAASTARDYYDCLAKGDAKGFLRGKVGVDTLPADYAEQLLKAVEQYQADMQQKHNGLREVRVADSHYNDEKDIEACRDTILHLTYAFLLLCYGDSTQEEIVVPMVHHSDRWLMK